MEGEDKEFEGVHVRAVIRFDPLKPDGAKLLEMQAWPLPGDVCEKLAIVLRDRAFEWLTEQGLSDGSIVDLSAKGPKQ